MRSTSKQDEGRPERKSEKPSEASSITDLDGTVQKYNIHTHDDHAFISKFGIGTRQRFWRNFS